MSSRVKILGRVGVAALLLAGSAGAVSLAGGDWWTQDAPMYAMFITFLVACLVAFRASRLGWIKGAMVLVAFFVVATGALAKTRGAWDREAVRQERERMYRMDDARMAEMLRQSHRNDPPSDAELENHYEAEVKARLQAVEESRREAEIRERAYQKVLQGR